MYGQQHLAYAPTPYSYTPTSTLSLTINPDEEHTLEATPADRDLYESLAEIYSIIVTLEALERAYLKDSVPEQEYTETCNRLLKQYRSNLSNSSADENVLSAFGDLDRFKSKWMIEAPRATERIRIGLPASLDGGTGAAATRGAGSGVPELAGTGGTALGSGAGVSAAATNIVTVSESFITLLDAIKMNILSKDTLHPLLVETIQAANKVTDRDFENKGKIVQWLITLNAMRAADELDAEQARDLHFDMTAAYEGFKAVL